ncbi:hypothetical protein [Campylobacter hyointestinalis]|uniref:hypothetical protein n=1 Tax=Campylobacter hyointestinalis TaxID=198 RepID=UPI0015EBC422|nr:hypothetical protein [Campylobacter hyointestinalis]
MAIYANVLIYLFAVSVILVIVSLIGLLGMILNMIFGEYLPYIDWDIGYNVYEVYG